MIKSAEFKQSTRLNFKSSHIEDLKNIDNLMNHFEVMFLIEMSFDEYKTNKIHLYDQENENSTSLRQLYPG